MEDGGHIGLAGVQGGVPQGGGDLHCLEHRGFHTTLGLANWGNSIQSRVSNLDIYLT